LFLNLSEQINFKWHSVSDLKLDIRRIGVKVSEIMSIPKFTNFFIGVCFGNATELIDPAPKRWSIGKGSYTILDYRFPILDCRMLDQLTVLAIEIMHISPKMVLVMIERWLFEWLLY
jgi:hypothetical protein